MGVARPASAITRCEVLDHAKQWVDAQVPYSQGSWGSYCAWGYYYTDPYNNQTYRPDCSGYVSAAWGLPGEGISTREFAGGPNNIGISYIIPYNDLRPGDALNTDGHIRLFGGWLDDNRDTFWGYETGECNTSAHAYRSDRWAFNANGYVAIRYNHIEECNGLSARRLPTQLTGNNAVTVSNWDDGKHVEVWARGQNGKLYHTWTFNDDKWETFAVQNNDAACGVNAGFWLYDQGYPEIFFPNNNQNVTHSWWNRQETSWGEATYAREALTDVSTLLWPDNRMEVFGLAPDGQIKSRHWKKDGDTWGWSEWNSWGGNFATGATAMVWGDGRPEVFATAKDGKVFQKWFVKINGQWQWSEWNNILTGTLASRPVPVLWNDGRIEIFGRNPDGFLTHAWYLDNEWHGLRVMHETPILGEPSAIFNPAGNGGPTGPQVFARDSNSRLIEVHMDANGWTEFRPLLADRVLASDPFGWIRRDGVAMLFAINEDGDLMESHRDPNHGWHTWKIISDGTPLDACVHPSDDHTATPPAEPDPHPDPDDGNEHTGAPYPEPGDVSTPPNDAEPPTEFKDEVIDYHGDGAIDDEDTETDTDPGSSSDDDTDTAPADSNVPTSPDGSELTGTPNNHKQPASDDNENSDYEEDDVVAIGTSCAASGNPQSTPPFEWLLLGTVALFFRKRG